MENASEQKIVKPHYYPRFVKISATLIALLFIYSLFFVPRYISASRLFKRGEVYFIAGQHDQAIEVLESAIEKTPSSRKIKLLLAKSYWSNQNQEDNEIGLYHISDIEINTQEWQELVRFMPLEYKEQFYEIE